MIGKELSLNAVGIFIALLFITLAYVPALASGSADSNSPPLEVPLIRSFVGISCSKCAVYPPDVQMAAGPKDVMETTNSRIGIWTKDGTLVKNETLHDLFNSSTPNLTDPRLTFDNTSSRWFASAFIENGSTILLAVSRESDPTLPWTVHNFNSSTPCPDQPSLGVNNDTVEISVNAYRECTESGRDFVGLEYWIVNKADLLAGSSPPRMWHYGPARGFFDLHPVRSFAASNMSYMVSVGSNASGQLFISAVQGAPPNPKSWDSSWPTLTISPTIAPPNATQRGSPHLINTVDSRVQDAIWDNGMLWVAFNQACIPQNDTIPRSCLEIIGIQTHGASRMFNSTDIRDVTMIGSGENYYYFPALAMDKRGDLIVVFGYSSANDYPSVAYTTINVNGTAARAGSPVTIQRGTGADSQCYMVHEVCRYGDYFGAASDPTNPGIVWVAGETMTAQGWSTVIAELGVAPSQGNPAETVAVFVLAVLIGILVAYVVIEVWDRIQS